jgi:hypothetical protein
MKIILLYITFGRFLNPPQEEFGGEMNKIIFVRPQVCFFSFKSFEQTDGIWW